jgi:hypothetical protein
VSSSRCRSITPWLTINGKLVDLAGPCTEYEPDCDYVDGVIQTRHAGDRDHYAVLSRSSRCWWRTNGSGAWRLTSAIQACRSNLAGARWPTWLSSLWTPCTESTGFLSFPRVRWLLFLRVE